MYPLCGCESKQVRQRGLKVENHELRQLKFELTAKGGKTIKMFCQELKKNDSEHHLVTYLVVEGYFDTL